MSGEEYVYKSPIQEPIEAPYEEAIQKELNSNNKKSIKAEPSASEIFYDDDLSIDDFKKSSLEFEKNKEAAAADSQVKKTNIHEDFVNLQLN